MKLAPTRVYIAGPMTGLPDLNFPAFHAAAALYRSRGCVVINPAEICETDPAAVVKLTKAEYLEHWRKCMRKDVAEMLTCDMVVMLGGWTMSRGATLEHHLACALGLAIVWHDE